MHGADLTHYTEGLHPLGGGCHAWLEPPGGWGLSNSGVLHVGDELLIVDTQNDMRLAKRLQAALAEETGGQEPGHTTVINTHHDIDHWAGNVVFDADRIIATEAATTAMRTTTDPDALAGLAEPGTALDAWSRNHAEAFDYTAWKRVEPGESFTGSKTIPLGDVSARLIEVGPAHTAGDAVVHVRHAGVVFAGDILFHRTTPISWASVSGQIRACEAILALEPEIVVPGHGPVAGPDGVREVRDYFTFVQEYAGRCLADGMSLERAYREIDLDRYRAWPHASRVYQNLACAYAESDGQPPPQPISVMERIIADEQEPRS